MSSTEQRRARLRPSASGVLATVALVAALAGGAYAAATIGPGDIKADAVRAKHIKQNAVRTAEIKDGQVQPSDLSAAAQGLGQTTRAYVKEALPGEGAVITETEHGLGSIVTATQDLPAGTYHVTVTGTVGTNDTSVECRTGLGDTLAFARAGVETAQSVRDSITLQFVHEVPAGAPIGAGVVALSCIKGDEMTASGEIADVVITAVKVDSSQEF